MTDDVQRQWTEQRRWDDSGPAVSMRTMVLDHDRRLDDLEHWRAELRGAFLPIRIAIGSSIGSGILAAIAIADMLSRGH